MLYITAIILKNKKWDFFVYNGDQMGYGLYCSPVKELDELHELGSFLISYLSIN